MKISRDTDVSGTSFHCVTVTATLRELAAAMGEPMQYSSGKVFCEWAGKTKAGHVFTVYDWKHSCKPRPDFRFEWHIGGFSKAEAEQAKREILELLKVGGGR
jgi:hypothetical protein